VIRYEQNGRKANLIVKKIWTKWKKGKFNSEKDMTNMDDAQVEKWKDMDIMEEK
jgi:hypothetical protein